ncbi:DALR anticodon-binding domain-containing protein, partial [Rhizobium brockwellii]|uniref:DALR anticodon-binding domain-containing protein n=1 Tax=Rhizobium brockwellii TaxID=3019932 RepID=UPI003F94D1F4
FQGFTGPFIQYTHARIKSILRKTGEGNEASSILESKAPLLKLEKQLAVELEQFPIVINDAATEHDPSKRAECFSKVKNIDCYFRR